MEIGQKVLLKGKSRHGKNRIEQHGDLWTVTGKGTFNGHPAMRLTSERESFNIGHGKKIKDNRWVFLTDDPNFLFFH